MLNYMLNTKKEEDIKAIKTNGSGGIPAVDTAAALKWYFNNVAKDEFKNQVHVMPGTIDYKSQEDLKDYFNLVFKDKPIPKFITLVCQEGEHQFGAVINTKDSTIMFIDSAYTTRRSVELFNKLKFCLKEFFAIGKEYSVSNSYLKSKYTPQFNDWSCGVYAFFNIKDIIEDNMLKKEGDEKSKLDLDKGIKDIYDYYKNQHQIEDLGEITRKRNPKKQSYKVINSYISKGKIGAIDKLQVFFNDLKKENDQDDIRQRFDIAIEKDIKQFVEDFLRHNDSPLDDIKKIMDDIILKLTRFNEDVIKKNFDKNGNIVGEIFDSNKKNFETLEDLLFDYKWMSTLLNQGFGEKAIELTNCINPGDIIEFANALKKKLLLNYKAGYEDNKDTILKYNDMALYFKNYFNYDGFPIIPNNKVKFLEVINRLIKENGTIPADPVVPVDLVPLVVVLDPVVSRPPVIVPPEKPKEIIPAVIPTPKTPTDVPKKTPIIPLRPPVIDPPVVVAPIRIIPKKPDPAPATTKTTVMPIIVEAPKDPDLKTPDDIMKKIIEKIAPMVHKIMEARNIKDNDVIDIMKEVSNYIADDTPDHKAQKKKMNEVISNLKQEEKLKGWKKNNKEKSIKYTAFIGIISVILCGVSLMVTAANPSIFDKFKSNPILNMMKELYNAFSRNPLILSACGGISIAVMSYLINYMDKSMNAKDITNISLCGKYIEQFYNNTHTKSHLI